MKGTNDMIARSNNSRSQEEEQFQEALHVGMRSLGWLLPETEAEVEAASQEDANEGREPGDELENPVAALVRQSDADRNGDALLNSSDVDGG